MPNEVCDTHVHIVAPLTNFPMVDGREYTPPPATMAGLMALRRRLGVHRNIVVQPSIYGNDNRCLIETLKELGDSARGIAVVSPDIADSELDYLDRLGIRGLRVNLESISVRDPALAREALDNFAGRIARWGWHIELYAILPVIAALADQIANLKIPTVIDHFGMAKAEAGIGQPGFSALLELVRCRKAFVKLSAPNRISNLADYSDVTPLARALIEEGPDQVIWASDWPHTGRTQGHTRDQISPHHVVNDQTVFKMLSLWCGDDAGLHRQILEVNPYALYRF
jgi:predicted TIM-barrel fold metal-dependent hydrolase